MFLPLPLLTWEGTKFHSRLLFLVNFVGASTLFMCPWTWFSCEPGLGNKRSVLCHLTFPCLPLPLPSVALSLQPGVSPGAAKPPLLWLLSSDSHFLVASSLLSWCWYVVFPHHAHHWSLGLPLLCWPPLQILRGLLFLYSSQSVLDVLLAQASVGTEQSYSCLWLQRHCAPWGLSHLCTSPLLCVPEPYI